VTAAPVRVGDLRPSQLLWAFGVGSVVDLPNFSVVVRGLDEWDESQCAPIGEERLLAAVRAKLGSQVAQLRGAPVPEGNGGYDPFGEAARVGVPVSPFPRWLRCPICQALGEIGTGVFTFKKDLFRPDHNRYVHETCPKAKRPPGAVAARFVVACANGHLDDFPWRYFIHRGAPGCSGALSFYESGASLETRNLWVKCNGCDVADRSMIEAFGEAGRKSLPLCRGHHPHLDSFGEDCGQPLRAMLLGASNGWFPETLTLLSVPTKEGKLAQLVDESWVKLSAVTSLDVLAAFRQIGQLGPLAEFGDDEIYAAIAAKRASDEAGVSAEAELDLKTPEWHVFQAPNPSLNGRDFRLAEVDPPSAYEKEIEGVVLAERLREVNALIGFTRIQPPGELHAEHGGAHRGPLVEGHSPTWAPATEVRGEGIVVRFALDRLQEWLAEKSVSDREAQLRQANAEWRAARKLEPADEGYPGVLYVLLHSFSHALMRELVLECGYGAASVRERIYASGPGKPVEMAGVLVYTAAPDSEGTLGGLVRLGEPDELGRLVQQALGRAQLCASDPLCSEHDPIKDGTLHGAACHACLFAPETSCEIGNRFLDRSLLVSTFRGAEDSFFASVG
jgi:hypothetical protein